LFNVDHMVNFEKAVEIYGNAGKAFKGNLDPVADILHSIPEECKKRVISCIREAEGRKYMVSAGCEIPAEVSDEVFTAFCEAAKL